MTLKWQFPTEAGSGSSEGVVPLVPLRGREMQIPVSGLPLVSRTGYSFKESFIIPPAQPLEIPQVEIWSPQLLKKTLQSSRAPLAIWPPCPYETRNRNQTAIFSTSVSLSPSRILLVNATRLSSSSLTLARVFVSVSRPFPSTLSCTKGTMTSG
jgi:hypothetical protein